MCGEMRPCGKKEAQMNGAELQCLSLGIMLPLQGPAGSTRRHQGLGGFTVAQEPWRLMSRSGTWSRPASTGQVLLQVQLRGLAGQYGADPT